MNNKQQLRKLQCNNKVIEYTLIRKSVKNINMRIKKEGTILVSANNKVPVSYIDSFVLSKQEYIFEILDKYKEQEDQQQPMQYVTGEKISILGKSYILQVIKYERELVEMNDKYIFLFAKDISNLKRKERILLNWLRQYQTKLFEQICREIYPEFERMGIEYPVIKIRKMTSRWGSCATRRGFITLNSKLIEVPRECIEYVAVHEFSHFIHPNHSRDFYALVETIMPDWKERRDKLRKFE